MSEDELKFYLEVQPKFNAHFLKNKHSLLAKIYGVFTITTQYMNER